MNICTVHVAYLTLPAQFLGYTVSLYDLCRSTKMDVAAPEKFIVTFLRSPLSHWLYLTHTHNFIRNVIQISYILMVQDRQKF